MNITDDEMEQLTLWDVQSKLREITKGCRPNMHEPDEQGVSAIVTGYILDNAGTANEITVLIANEVTGQQERFLLADLIALARMAVLPAFTD